MKAIFHPEAHEEMIESARFYEGRSEGFGTEFLTAVEETIRRIEQFPETAPIDRANIRKRLVSGFPFTILYECCLTASSSQPLCINIADLVTGRNACRRRHRALFFQRTKPQIRMRRFSILMLGVMSFPFGDVVSLAQQRKANSNRPVGYS